MIENNPSNVSSAFEMLLREIEAEIEFTNKVGSRAFEARDYDRAREALERAAQITAFREKADALRREWDALTSRAADEEEETRSERRDLGRLARGLRTPEDAFRLPILQALVDLGGAGQMAEVLEKVRQVMQGVLKEVDYQPLASDPDLPRWRNTAQWSRAAMVKEGLIKGDSRRGIWEISDAGRRHLNEQKDE
ncbi:MAG: winged helix-turn-helix domain-containing protein [Thermogutta sp.]